MYRVDEAVVAKGSDTVALSVPFVYILIVLVDDAENVIVTKDHWLRTGVSETVPYPLVYCL
jgi:hypothetical protein